MSADGCRPSAMQSGWSARSRLSVIIIQPQLLYICGIRTTAGIWKNCLLLKKCNRVLELAGVERLPERDGAFIVIG